MLTTTVSRIRCLCGGALELDPKPKAGVAEVRSGHLVCAKCKGVFLILAGVALLVEDVHQYILGHVKGVSKLVRDDEIPEEFRDTYIDAKAEIQTEHIEEDLEAERVNALYLMNHYLRVKGGPESAESGWWKPLTGSGSPLIDELIRKHWDEGPFSRIAGLAGKSKGGNAVELGCGVGGLYPVIKDTCDTYLGVDYSFASIALARHIALGVPYKLSLRIPEDLINGTVSREISIPAAKSFDGSVDFIVGDLQRPPLAKGEWDISLALNAIDMMEDPAELPRLQHEMLKKGGTAIQSCPYIWHEAVAQELRAKLPEEIRDSARAAEWLYRQAGFELGEVIEHQPWLFFKHVRQLEIYSVHLFAARKR